MIEQLIVAANDGKLKEIRVERAVKSQMDSGTQVQVSIELDRERAAQIILSDWEWKRIVETFYALYHRDG